MLNADLIVAGSHSHIFISVGAASCRDHNAAHLNGLRSLPGAVASPIYAVDRAPCAVRRNYLNNPDEGPVRCHHLAYFNGRVDPLFF